MTGRNRTLLLLAGIAALYFLAAWVDPCDGHSCPPGERVNAFTLRAE